MLLSALSYIIANPSSMWINQQAFAFMRYVSNPLLTSIMQALAESFYIVLPLVALYMYIGKKDADAYSFVVAAVILFMISDTIKSIVGEPRPCTIPGEVTWLSGVGCESSFSFPSNHASVLTGLLFFTGRHRYIRVLYVVWLALVLFGRVYLGAHYLTDVLAGIAISLAVAYLIYTKRRKINALVNRIVGMIIPRLALKDLG